MTGRRSQCSNRQKTKLSYRTTFNMKQIISSHNAKIIRKSEAPLVKRTCNCRNKVNCPLEGKCLVDNLIYQATLTPIPSLSPNTPPVNLTPTQPQTLNYIGLASTTFKVRLGNHKKSFNHKKYSKETTLSQKIWELREEGIECDIKWKLIERAQPYSPITGLCALCTLEKYYIIFKPEQATINKKNEVNNHCFNKIPVLLDKT